MVLRCRDIGRGRSFGSVIQKSKECKMVMRKFEEKTEETESIFGTAEIGRASRETSLGKTEYSLFRKDAESESFWIRVKNEAVTESGFLTGNLSEVALLFEKIVSGEIPPYILSEVLEDYSKERILYSIKN